MTVGLGGPFGHPSLLSARSTTSHHETGGSGGSTPPPSGGTTPEPSALVAQLETQFGSAMNPALRAELRSLATETDPTLFYEGLLNLGIRQEQGNQVEIAGALYSAVVGAGSVAGSTTTSRAQGQL